MIRNYYTDSFQGGRSITPSDTLLINGSPFAASSTTSNDNAIITASNRIVLGAFNLAIKRNMELSGAGIPTSGSVGYPLIIENADIISSTTTSLNGAITLGQTITNGAANAAVKVGMTISGNGIVGAPRVLTVNGANTVYTIDTPQTIALNTLLTYSGTGYEFDLSAPITLGANVALTYSSINQSSWEQYNIYVGTSPGDASLAPQALGKVSTTATATSTSFLIDSPDPNIQVGMLVTDFTNQNGITIGTKVSSITNGGRQIGIDTEIPAATLTAGAVVNFTFENHATIRLRTIDNSILTFQNPPQGQILPVSAVQVFTTGTANGANDLIALK